MKHFNTASNEVFPTHLISKPIKIQFFPGCVMTTKVLESPLPRKDIVIGWDIITMLAKLRILPEGERYKQHFQPYVQTPRLFMIDQEAMKQIAAELKQTSCASSHQEFLKKCPHPL